MPPDNPGKGQHLGKELSWPAPASLAFLKVFSRALPPSLLFASWCTSVRESAALPFFLMGTEASSPWWRADLSPGFQVLLSGQWDLLLLQQEAPVLDRNLPPKMPHWFR